MEPLSTTPVTNKQTVRWREANLLGTSLKTSRLRHFATKEMLIFFLQAITKLKAKLTPSTLQDDVNHANFSFTYDKATSGCGTIENARKYPLCRYALAVALSIHSRVGFRSK